MGLDSELRILVVDDDEDDFLIAKDLLEEIPGVALTIDWVSSYDEAIEVLRRKEHDIYFFDYHMGAHTGLELLREAMAMGVEAPILLLTGERDREVDMEVMEAGARAYLVKGQIDASQLDRSIRYAIRQKQAEGQILHQAQHDALTGLPNRQLFQQGFDRALAHASQFAQRIAALFIDLDSFKHINDTYGHSAGDAVLKTVAKRLAASVRLTDAVARQPAQGATAGRLGGDEFIVVLTNVERTEDVAQIANRIISAVAKPCPLPGGKTAAISASLGIALYPEDGQDVAGLLKKADSAMYRAKAQGKNQFCFVGRTDETEVVGPVAALKLALTEGKLRPRYFPIRRLDGAGLMALEVVGGGSGADLSDLGGAELALLARGAGLSERYDRWLVREARDQALAWAAAALPQLPLSVRLDRSSQTTANLAIIGSLARELGQVGAALSLVLSGSHVASSGEQLEILQQIASSGSGLGVDEMERSAISLISLSQLPVNVLWIGSEQLAEIESAGHVRSAVRSVTALAKVNGCATIARGVRTQQQCDILRSLGCDAAQGPVWGAALTAEQAGALLRGADATAP